MGFLGNGVMSGIGRGLNMGSNNFMQLLLLKKQQEMEQQKMLQQKVLEEQRMAQLKAYQDAMINNNTQEMGFKQQEMGIKRDTLDNALLLQNKEMNAVNPLPVAPTPAVPGMLGQEMMYPTEPKPLAPQDMMTNLVQANPTKFADLLPKMMEKSAEPTIITSLKAALKDGTISEQGLALLNKYYEGDIFKNKTGSFNNETEEKYDEKTGIKFKRSFNYDPSTGKKTDFSDWTAVSKDKKPDSVNVTTNVGTNSMEKLGEEMSKDLVGQRKDVEGAASSLRNIEEAEKLLDAGIITGTGAEFLTNFGNFLSSRLGVKFSQDPVANTQAYTATMGNQVGQIIKQFGSGTGLSDADREYAEKIVGGKITLNEQALRKLLAINKKAFTNVVSGYNKKATKAMSKPGAEGLPYDLRVDVGTTKGASTTIRYDSKGNRVQ